MSRKKNEAVLQAELIPTGTWGANLRALLPPSGWDRLRKWRYELANNCCEICGDSGLNQGRKHAVECHESWEYNDNTMTQTLTGVQSLCPRCHMVKHYGRSMSVGALKIIRKHTAEVNGWNEDTLFVYEDLIFSTHSLRSKFRWTVDIQSQLQEWLDAGILKDRDVQKAIAKLKKSKYGED